MDDDTPAEDASVALVDLAQDGEPAFHVAQHHVKAADSAPFDLATCAVRVVSAADVVDVLDEHDTEADEDGGRPKMLRLLPTTLPIWVSTPTSSSLFHH